MGSNRNWPVVGQIGPKEFKYCNADYPLYYLWKHSYIAYYGTERWIRDSWLLRGVESFQQLRNKYDYMYIAEYSDHIVISHMGTNGNVLSWLENFDLFPFAPRREVETGPHIKNGRVHDGFGDAFDRVKPFVEMYFNYRKTGYDLCDKKLFVTGHSRGGSIASLTAQYLAGEKGVPCNLITYGSPGIGNKAFRDEFRLLPINSTWVRNGYDLVTYVPLRHGEANFVWLNKSRWWHRILLPLRIRDHYQVSYDKALYKRCVKKK